MRVRRRVHYHRRTTQRSTNWTRFFPSSGSLMMGSSSQRVSLNEVRKTSPSVIKNCLISLSHRQAHANLLLLSAAIETTQHPLINFIFFLQISNPFFNLSGDGTEDDDYQSGHGLRRHPGRFEMSSFGRAGISSRPPPPPYTTDTMTTVLGGRTDSTEHQSYRRTTPPLPPTPPIRTAAATPSPPPPSPSRDLAGTEPAPLDQPYDYEAAALEAYEETVRSASTFP